MTMRQFQIAILAAATLLSPTMGFSPAGGIMASVRKLLAINGDNTVALADEEQIEVTDEDRKMPLAPSLTFEKYVTLQVSAN